NARDRLLGIWGPRTGPIPPASDEPADGSGKKTESVPDAPPVPRATAGATESVQASSSMGSSNISKDHAGFLEKLIAANQHARSWREKLEAVRELLSNSDVIFAAEELWTWPSTCSFLAQDRSGASRTVDTSGRRTMHGWLRRFTTG